MFVSPRHRPRRLLAAALSASALLAALAPTSARAADLGGHLSGVVEDAKGTVLPSATVALRDATGAAVASTVAGSDGRYDIDVYPGTYRLTADARSAGTPVHATVAAVTVGAATPLDVVIVGRPGGLVDFRGRLLDSNGSPIVGGTLSLERDSWTATGADGSFVLGVPPGKYKLSISPAGFRGVQAWMGEFDLTRDRVGDITLPLVAHDIVVRNSSGAPFGRAYVTMRPTQDPGPGEWNWSTWGETDDTGHARFGALATGNFTVEVTPPGYSDHVTKKGIDGRHSTTVDVTLPAQESRLRLYGTSTDSDGVTFVEPNVRFSTTEAAPTYFSSRSYANEADVAFALDAPMGTYTLSFSTALGELNDWAGGDPSGDLFDLSSPTFRHDQGRRVAFRLPPSPGLTVRVVDPQGAPVAGARVTATSTIPAGSAGVELAPGLPVTGTVESRRVTGADGVTVLRTLPGHPPASIHIEPPSERGLDDDVTVPAGAAAIDVHLDRGAIVSGTIRTGGQPGSPNWHVNLVSKDGNVSRPVTVGADGSYHVRVPTGTYRVATDDNQDEPGGESDDHSNSYYESSTFSVSGDRTLDLDFPARSGASVRFVGSDGNPIEGEIGLDSASLSAMTLAPGITASASAWFGAFGERDSDGIPAWPGGATVSGDLGSSTGVRFSGIRLDPGDAAVVALAEGYSLMRPWSPGNVTGAVGNDGSATISWDQSGDGRGNPILGYYLWIWGPGYRSMVVPAPATSMTISCLLPNSHYDISISAMTVRGVGDSGTVARFDTPAAWAGPAQSCPPPDSALDSPVPPGAIPPEDPPHGDPGHGGGGAFPNITPGPSGYWMLESDGTVHAFGAAVSTAK